MQKISFDDVKSAQAVGQPPIINVLTADKFAQTKIPGAINIPMDIDDFAEKVEAYVGCKEKAVILYCASKECPASKNAAKILEEAGFTDVRCYEGGAKEFEQKSESLKAA